MISINQYRSQIGNFRQRIISKKFLQKQESYDRTSCSRNQADQILNVIKLILKLVALAILIGPPSAWRVKPSPPPPCSTSQSRILHTEGLEIRSRGRLNSWCIVTVGVRGKGTGVLPLLDLQVGNFWAKYINGNIKGIHNLHFNIRSLKYKVSEIKNIIYSEKPTLIGLSECELRKENIDIEKLKVPGYVILFPKSWDLYGFARIVVYVRRSFKYQQVHDLEDHLVQSVWLKGSLYNSKPVYFCHAYREHSSAMGSSINNQKQYLNILLSQWEKATELHSPSQPNEVHVMLDMNLDYLPSRWLQPGYRLYSLTKLVQNTCNANNFSQLVKEPTRAMYNSVSGITDISCIDHVYCNYRHKCSTPRVLVSGASDHDILSYVRFSKNPPSPARVTRRRSYKNFVQEEFLQHLSLVDWTEVYTNPDLDSAVEIFTEKFRFILNQHAPWVIFQLRKNFRPWLTDETKEMMKQRDLWKAKAKALANANPGGCEAQEAAWGEYKRLRNKINNVKGNEENSYKKEKIEEVAHDSAKVWKCTKTFMKWKSPGTPSQLEENGVLITSAKKIADLMNHFFINKISLIRSCMSSMAINLSPCFELMLNKRCKLSLSHVTVTQVRKLLAGLSNSRATAVDELDNFSVKVAAPVIAGPLHHLITMSIMQHRFPKNWKWAKVLPLHKKQDPLCKKNYRPVAILSPLSKVLEKLVYGQMYQYFTTNKILHPSLHGYRSNRSTQTALLQMYDRWVKAASQGRISGAVLLDLSAAFDLVSPDILVSKLEIYGLDEEFLAWVKSYLSGRYQAVWIDHVSSDFIPCEVGVPQGSILGPLFFMLYVNDLPHILTCAIDQYADDSTLHAAGGVAEVSAVLEENCELVSNWMGENMLQLNADKTHILTLGTRERLAIPGNSVEVTMDGIKLKEAAEHSEALLGVVVDANLKWHGQISTLLSKLKKRIAGLSHVRSVLPFSLRKSVSEGLFTSVLSYCLPLFGGCDAGEIRDLQVLQNKVAQLVTMSPPRSVRNPMYDSLGWLTVHQLTVYHTLLAVYRVRTTKEPEYLADCLCKDNRNGNIIVTPTRLSLLKNSFTFRGACAWNKLPPIIRSIPRIGIFKKRIKAWIKENIPRFLE